MGAVNKRLPGRKIEMEDGGVKYTQEVELPNGHKWRQRADGGWCRFSKKTCYPKGGINNNGSSKVGFTGLNQNRSLRELTHNELVKAFKKSGFTLSGHSVKRLKDIRTKAMGFETLNDIKKIFNKGTKFDAGRGDIGYSYSGLEVIINPKTNNIITFRPAKTRN